MPHLSRLLIFKLSKTTRPQLFNNFIVNHLGCDLHAPVPVGRGGRTPVPAGWLGALCRSPPADHCRSFPPRGSVPGSDSPHGHPATLTASRGLTLHSLSLQNTPRPPKKFRSRQRRRRGPALTPLPGSRPGEGPWAWWGPARSAAKPRPLTPAARGGGSAGCGAARAKTKESGAHSARARRGAAATKPPPPRPPAMPPPGSGAPGQTEHGRRAGRETTAERSRRRAGRPGGRPCAPRVPRRDLSGR